MLVAHLLKIILIYYETLLINVRRLSKINVLSEAKVKILWELWKSEKPLTLKDIVESTGIKGRSVNMHLLWLRRVGYVSAVRKGLYSITDTGKEKIGFPKMTPERAKFILRNVSFKESFHFYLDINKPLGISAYNINEFYDLLRKIEIKSVEFHAYRGDFELWIHFLGDVELAKKLRLLRERSLLGEKLREEILDITRRRIENLKRSAGM
ncbi:TPA: transcriptional regulator [Candidatus Bathyarchaeota archaeon]|nr:transcriptional regulator [Candidatus Bathyarchaeota archaeon]